MDRDDLIPFVELCRMPDTVMHVTFDRITQAIASASYLDARDAAFRVKRDGTITMIPREG